MFIAESFLNKFYRKRMMSIAEFDDVSNVSIPKKVVQDSDDYLLYIHIPFCESLCPYCSFHRFVLDENIAKKYFKALRKELQMYKDLNYDFKGLYVGGGTPTIMMDELLETIKVAKNLFDIKEISVETNPNHVTDENIKLLKQIGVNRLSVGVQSFDDNILKQIGRYDKYGSGKEIMGRLRNAIGEFDTLNIDFIFNIPTQSEESLRRDLDIIDDMLVDQVTFYPLMSSANVEKNIKNTLGSVDYKQEKKFYFTILNRMRKNYSGSTAWCFSRNSTMIDEYIIAYNKHVGVGSGAFGYFNDSAYANTFSLNEYIDRINNNELPIASVKKFTGKENMYYFLLMKLFGLSMSKQSFKEKFGISLNKALRSEMVLLKLFNAIKESGDTIELTDRGRYYWVMGMREFFIAVDNLRDRCRERVRENPEETYFK